MRYEDLKGREKESVEEVSEGKEGRGGGPDSTRKDREMGDGESNRTVSSLHIHLVERRALIED